jgi:hypothetical protein
MAAAAPTAKPKANKPRPLVAAALARGRAAGKQAAKKQTREEGNVSSTDDEVSSTDDDEEESEPAPAVPPLLVAAAADVPEPAVAAVPDEAVLLDPDHIDLSNVYRMYREFVVEWTRPKPFIKRGEPKTQKVQISTVSLTFLQDPSF